MSIDAPLHLQRSTRYVCAINANCTFHLIFSRYTYFFSPAVLFKVPIFCASVLKSKHLYVVPTTLFFARENKFHTYILVKCQEKESFCVVVRKGWQDVVTRYKVLFANQLSCLITRKRGFVLFSLLILQCRIRSNFLMGSIVQECFMQTMTEWVHKFAQ